jgi:hypothetical protein
MDLERQGCYGLAVIFRKLFLTLFAETTGFQFNQYVGLDSTHQNLGW